MTESPHQKRMHDLIQAQAAATPQLVAVRAQHRSLTYVELDFQSDALAAHLQAIAAASPVIGITTTRSLDMVVAILAIWKAGKAYLPLDPEYPAARLHTMIADAGLQFCCTPSAEVFFFEELGLRAVDYEQSYPSEKPVPTSGDLGYILFTSGSTGVPKGAGLPHSALVNLIDWQNAVSSAGEGTATIQFSPLSFDPSFLEIGATLSTGGTLVIMDEALRKDPANLLRFLDTERIGRMYLPFVALQYLAEEAVAAQLFPSSLRELMTAGEQLKVTPQLVGFMKGLHHCVLDNQYGPTEAHVVTCLRLDGDPDSWPALPAIGTPIHNVQIYMLGHDGKPVPQGEQGELVIAGVALATGYLNRPELTAEKFTTLRLDNGGDVRIYRSGDLARFLPDGNIEFLGRIDQQVKIRGYRVEPGEVEVALANLEGVTQAAVIAADSRFEGKRLIGYLVSDSAAADDSWRSKLRETLPEYMIPSVFIRLDHFPMTSSGKIDRKLLPLPDDETVSPISGNALQRILHLWSAFLSAKVPADQSFFEIGGNSLLALRTVAMLKSLYGYEVPVTQLYRNATAEKLAQFIDGKRAPKSQRSAPRARGKQVAVIGMAGRFPGADSVDALWEMLKNGKEGITWFSNEEIDDSVSDAERAAADYVAARGLITDADKFDAAFFGIVPAQADTMDPQHRVFLEIAWELMERAGHLPEHYGGRVGVFAGCGNNTYYQHNVLPNRDLVDRVGAFQVMTLNEKDYLATRTAYSLGLTGPAVSVVTACSTSLLAVAQAVESIRAGNCEVAIAGGASVTAPLKSGHRYEEGAMFSKDGHTRTFDADATGTVFSDGAAAILLKDLDEAIADNDTIYAVINGVGYNNDGADKGSFTAPSAAGQAGAISAALTDAGVTDPSVVTYVEAHGTATPIGDPIELEGLAEAFAAARTKQFCALGSLKSNIGHLTAAAGVAGLIKVALSLYHRQLPPTINYSSPNPLVDFTNSPFFVNDHLADWTAPSPLTAGVSSFGVGGTNVHVVLGEAPVGKQTKLPEKPASLLRWSAKTSASADAYAARLAGFIENRGDVKLEDIAYALSTAKRDFSVRRFIVASPDDAAAKVEAAVPASNSHQLEYPLDEVAFIFPGQGAQYAGMGQELYTLEPAFAAAVDECSVAYREFTGEDIRDVLFERQGQRINDTRYTQPALFVFEYALARYWMSRGIVPSAMLGHSIGEFAAAHLAGVFSLRDAVKLVAARGRLIGEMPAGDMLTVRADAAQLAEWLVPGVVIAAYNSRDLNVVSGNPLAIDRFSAILDEKNIVYRKLATSHAFHSGMMDAVLQPFREVIAGITLHAPRVPLVSCVTGDWMSAAMATSPEYWVKQLREPVRFTQAIATLTTDRARALLETGPGNGAFQLIRPQLKPTSGVVIAGVDPQSEYASLLTAEGRLWLHGIAADAELVYGPGRKTLAGIPIYAFDRKRHWAEPVTFAAVAPRNIPATEPAATADTPAASGLLPRVMNALEEVSGMSLAGTEASSPFVELGLDSLILTMVALRIKSEFKVPVSFRQLNGELNSPARLASYLESLTVTTPGAGPSAKPVVPDVSISATELEEIKKPFGATARIDKTAATLSPKQATFLRDFIARYNRKTAKSKQFAEDNRKHMADPRSVSGFKPATKEIVYPIVVDRSEGSRLWDIDGNEYVDALNGFGSNFLGYQHPAVKSAVLAQIDAGYEIGPQHLLAGEVCKLICELTHTDRSALCNTGSEAVLGAMRIARTVTGRSLIASFNGSYHGINDEVIVRGTKNLKAFPAAPGIMNEAVENMLAVDYGADDSLRIISEQAPYLAAILVEPIQSRRPEFVPVEFLRELRKIADESGAVLIFDEVISGFRFHAGGAQALLGIEADLGTYGKVVGGGMPIGIIAGKKMYMDALDGGDWRFGDDSSPQAGVTYFAGTFVRHPLALAASKAVLTHLVKEGPALQESLNRMTSRLADGLNAICTQYKLPFHAVSYGSLWKLKLNADAPYHELLFALMREKGIHIQDVFPCFLTTAHTEADVTRLLSAFRDSVAELTAHDFLVSPATMSQKNDYFAAGAPPVPGARLGRDRDGNPAWYVPDQANPGKYLQVDA